MLQSDCKVLQRDYNSVEKPRLFNKRGVAVQEGEATKAVSDLEKC